MMKAPTLFELQRVSKIFLKFFDGNIFYLNQILSRSLICKADESSAAAVTMKLRVLELGQIYTSFSSLLCLL